MKKYISIALLVAITLTIAAGTITTAQASEIDAQSSIGYYLNRARANVNQPSLTKTTAANKYAASIAKSYASQRKSGLYVQSNQTCIIGGKTVKGCTVIITSLKGNTKKNAKDQFTAICTPFSSPSGKVYKAVTKAGNKFKYYGTGAAFVKSADSRYAVNWVFCVVITP
jgi:hypothetical protein